MDETTPAGTPEPDGTADPAAAEAADGNASPARDEEWERQRQAAARSSGPLAGERAEPQPEQEAFRRAFEKALW